MSVFALLAAGSALVADIPQPSRFGEWIVACDNARHCEAIAGLSPADSDNGWIVRVLRDGDGTSKPTVILHPSFNHTDGPALVTIDGRKSAFRISGLGALEGDAILFLKAMAKARRAQLTDADGNIVGELPVTGASAALRWIDDQQKRADTVSAIVAAGPKPARAVPAVPPLPLIKTPERSDAAPRRLDDTQIEDIRTRAECFQSYDSHEFFRLDAAHSLGLIACSSGAYQGYSIVIVIDEDGKWKPAPLERARPLPDWASELDGSAVTTASYSPENFRLSEFAKARGLADCGISASWVWDGAAFRLASYAELNECMGGPPGDWLPLWQTQNAPLIR